MEPKIIVVRGVKNTGKTEMIKKVYELLLDEYPDAKKEESPRLRVEVKAVITIDGIKIGIESRGDVGEQVADSLKCFVKKGCDLIICATRSRGKTVWTVGACEPTYTIEWYGKLRIDQGDMAREIMSDVQQFINTH